MNNRERTPDPAEPAAPTNMGKRTSGWAIVLGIVMFVLGLAAIASPLIAGAAVGAFVGW
ncbi:MAG: hypothetical protein WBA76_18690 [Phormidesmis sp.]